MARVVCCRYGLEWALSAVVLSVISVLFLTGNALSLERTPAYRAVAVVDRREVPRLALIFMSELLARRADTDVFIWIIAELILGENALTHGPNMRLVPATEWPHSLTA